MDEVKRWFFDLKADEAIRNLTRHGFEAVAVPDRLSACKEMLRRIPRTKTVGVGGSVTIRETGILDKLKEQGNTLYDHWKPGIGIDESLEIRRAALSSDLYLGSSNAVTLAGEIVNIDGFCNRISSMAFGPKEVVIVVGKNKLVKDVPEAIARIKNVAAPLNAKRLGVDTPCVKTGRCMDCDSPQRICIGTLVLERRPIPTNMVVILVQEDLGY